MISASTGIASAAGDTDLPLPREPEDSLRVLAIGDLPPLPLVDDPVESFRTAVFTPAVGVVDRLPAAPAPATMPTFAPVRSPDAATLFFGPAPDVDPDPPLTVRARSPTPESVELNEKVPPGPGVARRNELLWANTFGF